MLDELAEPTEPAVRALLDQYVAGFENADTTALELALRKDASLEMIPARTWFDGRETCLRYLAQVVGSPGDWLMTRTTANGRPAVAAYLRGGDGRHHAFGVAVLDITRTGITRIVAYGDPGLVARFGFPPVRDGR